MTEVLDSGGPHQLRLEVYEPENLEPVYANYLAIASSENEFVLIFLQSVPPALLRQEDLQALKSVRATAVAKIIVSPVVMEKFAKAFIESVTRYQQKKG